MENKNFETSDEAKQQKWLIEEVEYTIGDSAKGNLTKEQLRDTIIEMFSDDAIIMIDFNDIRSVFTGIDEADGVVSEITLDEIDSALKRDIKHICSAHNGKTSKNILFCIKINGHDDPDIQLLQIISKVIDEVTENINVANFIWGIMQNKSQEKTKIYTIITFRQIPL